MKRNLIMVLTILISFVLQTTVFQYFNFGGIAPNLLIIVTASYGFMFGKRYGMTVGFISGLLMDIFYGSVLGFYALIYLYIGAGNGIFHRVFYQNDIKLPLALITVSDLLYSFVCYILLFLLRGRFHIGFYFKSVIIPEIVYTIFVTVFLYPVILLLNKSPEKTEKRSDRWFVKKN